jgi:hypothetical protein
MHMVHRLPAARSLSTVQRGHGLVEAVIEDGCRTSKEYAGRLMQCDVRARSLRPATR